MKRNFFEKLVYFFLAFLGIASVWAAVTLLLSAEHYVRVYEDPMTVTATVTHYSSYDDDGTTRYRSYISYTADKTIYKNIKYENESSTDRLTPVGKQIQVEISPEDPSTLVADLKNSIYTLLFMMPAASLFVAVLWKLILTCKKKIRVSTVPEPEIIKRDAKMTLIGGRTVSALLLISLSFVFIGLRYSMVISPLLCIIAALIFAVLFLFFLNKTVRNVKYINYDEYEVRHDVLVDKEISYTDESCSFLLHYQTNGGDKWSTTVTQSFYYSSNPGDVVISVFLPNKKKPLIHYFTERNVSANHIPSQKA